MHHSPRARRVSITLARRLVLAAALALAVIPATASAQAKNAKALPPELEKAKALLDKYRDPVVAVHDGFLSTLGCVQYPKGGNEGAMQYKPGGMGVHFINFQNVGKTLDPAKPQVLI